ncbi:bifunctional adenosylcobinamide kinase/adenosylcobinamide-phosphate guanylyltransferase [Spongiibacter sp. KMU-158]|uniref:Bifunctional adenosylcobalamin biosynthesis protein n=1 Tax=Spongiibacter pelagi TaxID=2760804 RepID=A0A927C414_9GAMM|nr:bifunctional adenosylcobinamide kinase/adenosylcobinamide-phosphate guanylyltransferase [Spongiibacter pelagi]MBD2859763.1 bifunctional adenosylcobinamide kinase/adenosylcobinamide-phosphate guanylyltransferase [Spongiibacter pelagi]
MLELYLGGARSGKSRLAEQRALQSGLEKIYIATAAAGDAEMTARIAHHQLQREGQTWLTVESPLALAETLKHYASSGRCLLVDCLTLWLSNALFAENEVWQRESEDLLTLLPELSGHIILVSNEVGQGIVPLGEINRRFVDESGRLHQRIAAIADRVVFVTAGIEQVLKAG